ncbi:hypothetical protein DCAR_0206066 [Daucus carota subsp. sativus]|uniref:Calmodulin-binding protein n=1 Tax=Daucus carota subsp. sativus TaxID=79200 RepID=A0AAF0WC81_DAUCS|nr:hypothetical protein DCAR_0206066 [Daucus carota subsp. sativus]
MTSLKLSQTTLAIASFDNRYTLLMASRDWLTVQHFPSAMRTKLIDLLLIQLKKEECFEISLYKTTLSSGASAWQLFFHNSLPYTLFTSSKVQSEDCEPLKIILFDSSSIKIITSGPMSSIKIQTVVLNGDFVAGDGENWTKNDFDSCVIREREGKRPLVTGDLTLTLRNGVAELGNISFADNSSWTRSRKFRLGARMQGIPDVRVKEAKTYKKHRQPSLADEVWRLERIAKDGVFHKRLSSAGIFTVKDFLRLYVFGGGISDRTCKTITGHAINCTLDDKIYHYCGAAERVVLVFNSIWKAIGAIIDGQNFQDLDELSQFQMVCTTSLTIYYGQINISLATYQLLYTVMFISVILVMKSCIKIQDHLGEVIMIFNL